MILGFIVLVECFVGELVNGIWLLVNLVVFCVKSVSVSVVVVDLRCILIVDGSVDSVYRCMVILKEIVIYQKVEMIFLCWSWIIFFGLLIDI